VNSTDIDASILSQARDWRDRLSCGVSSQARSAWLNWLASDPLHQTAYQRVCWGQVAPSPPAVSTPETEKWIVEEGDGGGVVGADRVDIKTRDTSFQFAYRNGWTVVLAPNSRLRLHPSNGYSQLRAGKALFTAQHNDAPPITVDSLATMIRTSRATVAVENQEGNATEVLLFTGRAAIVHSTHPPTVRALRAGQRARDARLSGLVISPLTVEDMTDQVTWASWPCIDAGR
jgi:ferric-dicitrate binding protein FerR (iron transport regulator)